MRYRTPIGLLGLAIVALAGCGGGELGDCTTEGCADSARTCLATDDGSARCECPEGTLEEAGECVALGDCMEGECGPHGTCDGATCTCEAGFAGPRCELCDAGFHDDGAGGCSDDLCTPDPCELGRRCVVADGAPACLCPAGQHDEDGTCLPDTTCMAETCAGRGGCEDASGSVSCTCDAGWGGTFCDACDEAGGYHDDGAGACTTDACLPSPCTDLNRTVCADDPVEGIVCTCDPRFHDDGAGGCTVDEVCDGRCGTNGTCTDAGGVVLCACDLGWTGGTCDGCDAAAGYHDDGTGVCTTDSCLPNTCTVSLLSVCSADAGGVTSCACDPGHHDEGGTCVVDEACTATSCNMHGACESTAGVVSCTCDGGWAGAYCGACDTAMGFHDDGAGGCTTDVCLPNPCTSSNRSVCAPDGSGGFSCACDPGHHEDGAACVIDEACTATSCNGHGTCTTPGGVVSCACGPGWAGVYCGMCDVAGGYHDDGAGGCTTDLCLPNPCIIPNRSMCSAVSGSPLCSCDAGYHDDGVGGCTTDVCVPDPCASSGRLCRDNGGAAECYTPACDDGEPCTDDTFDGVRCVFTPLGDGTSCSTTLCISNQTCAGAVCAGGAAVDCDDSNPCTDDSCDALTGCDNVPDDSNVPDDAIACTADSCSGGVATNALNDGACTDGLYCTGDEVCAPTDPLAAADGCVTRDVPRAPGPDGPCGTWACDEGSRAWTLNALGAGTLCDDGLVCTTGDSCSGAGACVGAPTALCGGDGPTACTGTTPFGAGGVDIPRASVRGAMTFEGGAPVPSVGEDEVNLWLQNQATGSLVHLEQIDFDSWDGSQYPVRSWDFRDDRVIDLDVIPGTYDVIYQRFWSSGNADRDWGGTPDGTYPFGSHVLESDLVLGPGTNALDLDIPAARVSGAMTFAGGAAVPSVGEDEVNLWLRDQATGSLVHLEQIDFDSWDGSQYPVRSWDFRDDRVIDLDVIPGTYDVIYQRFWSSGNADRDWGGGPDGSYPFGSHVIESGLVFGPGTNTLNVDIPAAHITGTLTFDGGPAVPSGGEDEVNLWLRDQATGSLVHLEQIDFDSWDGSQYPVRSWDFRDDRVIDLDVIPGTYDVIYQRFWSSGNADRDWGGGPDGSYPFGSHVLMSGVVIGPGANVLNVDIPRASVAGTLTFAGGAAIPSGGEDEVNLWLRDQATGSLVHLEQIDFDSWDGSQYPVRSWDFRDDRVIDLDVIPGTYDVIYQRFWSSGNADRDWGGTPDGTYPFGSHVLMSGVVIGPGANTLNVDIPRASVTGTLTFDGGAAAASVGEDEVNLWLRDQATGSLVHLEQIDFDSWDGSQYPVRSWDFRDDRVIDLDVIPGTYDVIYQRFWSSGNADRDWGGTPDGTYPFGSQLLVEGVVISASVNALNVDIPRASVAGALTFDGGPAVASIGEDEANVWLRSRSTGSLVHLEQIDFDSWDGSQYPVRSWDFRDDRVIDLDVIPGTYDLIYQRFWSSGNADRDWGGTPDGTYPFGSQMLRQCVSLP